MMSLKLFVATVALLALIGQTISATVTTTWTGASSSDWTDAGNWDNGVPSATTDVVISSGDVNLAAGSFTVLSLTTSDTSGTLLGVGSMNSTLIVLSKYNNTGCSLSGINLQLQGTSLFNGQQPYMDDVRIENTGSLSLINSTVVVDGPFWLINKGTFYVSTGTTSTNNVANAFTASSEICVIDNQGNMTFNGAATQGAEFVNTGNFIVQAFNALIYSDGVNITFWGNLQLTAGSTLYIDKSYPIWFKSNFTTTNSDPTGLLYIDGDYSQLADVVFFGSNKFTATLQFNYRNIYFLAANSSVYHLVWSSGVFLDGVNKTLNVDYFDMASTSDGADPSSSLTALNGFTLNVKTGGRWSSAYYDDSYIYYQYLNFGAVINVLSTAHVTLDPRSFSYEDDDSAGLLVASDNGTVGVINNWGRVTAIVGTYSSVYVIFNNYGTIDNLFDAAIFNQTTYNYYTNYFAYTGYSSGTWKFNAITGTQYAALDLYDRWPAVVFSSNWVFARSNLFNGTDLIGFQGLTDGEANAVKYFEGTNVVYNPTFLFADELASNYSEILPVISGNATFKKLYLDAAIFCRGNGSINVVAGGWVNVVDSVADRIVDGCIFTSASDVVYADDVDTMLTPINGGVFRTLAGTVFNVTDMQYLSTVGPSSFFDVGGDLVFGDGDSEYSTVNMVFRGDVSTYNAYYDDWNLLGLFVFFPSATITLRVDGDDSYDQWGVYYGDSDIQLGGSLHLVFTYTPSSGTVYQVMQWGPKAAYGLFAGVTTEGLPLTMAAYVSSYDTDNGDGTFYVEVTVCTLLSDCKVPATRALKYLGVNPNVALFLANASLTIPPPGNSSSPSGPAGNSSNPTPGATGTTPAGTTPGSPNPTGSTTGSNPSSGNPTSTSPAKTPTKSTPTGKSSPPSGTSDGVSVQPVMLVMAIIYALFTLF